MSKVDVFEVGFEQLGELAGWVKCEGVSIGSYVLATTWTRFGGGGHTWLCVFGETDSLNKALESQRRMTSNELRALRVLDIKNASEYEVWHVVDDFELWGNWDFRVREAKLDAQRKASACRISLDNGQTFLDPVHDDVDLQELIEHLDENPYDWDGIVVSAMDGETREFTHLTSSYTGMLPSKCMSTAKINAMWLCDYLMNAEQDLIW